MKGIKRKLFFRNIKILEVGEDTLIGARGYRLFRYTNSSGKWTYIGKVADTKFALASRFRLVSRLLRTEIHFFSTLTGGAQVCVAKNGIFKLNKTSRRFEKCFNITRGSRPLNLCEDTDGNLYFGEYFHNAEREPVHVYRSADQGDTWSIVYSFPAGSIRHIHGIHADPYTGALWVTTGDLEGECIIGYTTDQFATFNTVFRGGQEYRACNLLFFKDKVVYGTDSETALNFIKQFDRNTMKVTDIAPIQGSVISAVKAGDKCFLSTTVEPSEVNLDQNAYLWMYNNVNGEASVIASYRKDRLDHIYFQFGLCRLPEYKTGNCNHIYFSGAALRGIDGHSVGLYIGDMNQGS
jgi:hypothetical protein